MIGILFITILQYVWPKIASQFDRFYNPHPSLVAYARWRPRFYKWLALLAPIMIVLLYKYYDAGDAISLFFAYLTSLPMMLNHWLKAVWFDDHGLRFQ